jgi:RNA polymerase sigma factor FliA
MLQSNRDVSLEDNMHVIMVRLADAIDKLPDNERIVVVLYFVEHLNSKEIGAVLDLPESKVEDLYRRAMTRLRIASREGLA